MASSCFTHQSNDTFEVLPENMSQYQFPSVHKNTNLSDQGHVNPGKNCKYSYIHIQFRMLDVLQRRQSISGCWQSLHAFTNLIHDMMFAQSTESIVMKSQSFMSHITTSLQSSSSSCPAHWNGTKVKRTRNLQPGGHVCYSQEPLGKSSLVICIKRHCNRKHFCIAPGTWEISAASAVFKNISLLGFSWVG